MERTGVKRKRSGSSLPASSQPSSQFPSGSINPLSHTPSTLSQFLVAGLADWEKIPSKVIKNFPHSPWRDPASRRKRRARRGSSVASGFDSDGHASSGDITSTDGETEFETEADDETSRMPKDKKYAAERAALRPLAQSVAIFLSRGDVPSAKRAYGLLMRSKISGKRVDIRRNHYWELGAEILMREQPPEEHTWGPGPAANEEHAKRRLIYPLANVPKVRDYFEDLIRNYPYHKAAKAAASAMQFHPALLSYEMYQAHAHYLQALEQAEVDAREWRAGIDDPDYAMADGRDLGEPGHIGDDYPERSQRRRSFGSPSAAQEAQLMQAKDSVRVQALASMRELMERQDRLLEDPSFSRNGELLRLIGLLALYISDLTTPFGELNQQQLREAGVRKDRERQKARKLFERAIERGADVADPVKAALGMEVKKQESQSTFSTLPYRGSQI
ncbi:hypothetical protein B0T11DRAFT_271230 [Plectosphaerella cucumerina]|uniref:Uncharacterized protein n=1 Tax=Plectosphaerella cucumerina TaxID=40658 RepID=A0A8K0TPA3_9PEZI|nr:hypothetical protein B0T11DRAFT_271230 [Plectosphaerella cucumerina]